MKGSAPTAARHALRHQNSSAIWKAAGQPNLLNRKKRNGGRDNPISQALAGGQRLQLNTIATPGLEGWGPLQEFWGYLYHLDAMEQADLSAARHVSQPQVFNVRFGS